MAYGLINADVIGTSVAGSNIGAGNATLLKNRLIDAGFIINQRGYVSGTALSAGTYAHDRFKAGAGGCTYTFTQLSTGVPIVITITAGSLQQVIEGCNMPDGGTFTLSWTGTAQARVNGGTYGASPLAVTGITAGANTTIEFNTGTCSFPQLEVGTQATGYEYRQYGTELNLCQRYFQQCGNGFFGSFDGSTTVIIALTEKFNQTMRASPTLSVISGRNCQFRCTGSDFTNGAPTLANAVSTSEALWTQVYGFSGGSANAVIYARNNTSFNLFIGASAEL